MKSALAKVSLALVVIFSSLIIPAGATSRPVVNPTLGFDVSYPQCLKNLPSHAAFAIVGVNNGLANATNPCLVKQLSWSRHVFGKTLQPKVQLYVNTANPATQNTSNWPSNNVDPTGKTVDDPYGSCAGADSSACAWQYGWDRAAEDGQNRLPKAAAEGGTSPNPASYMWWLDVETINTWQFNSADSKAQNTADLEGMVAYFKSIGASVGLYSTAKQWNLVAAPNAESNLNGLPNWRPGAHNFNDAKSNCGLPPLTGAGKVALTQYSNNGIDYDYSCSN